MKQPLYLLLLLLLSLSTVKAQTTYFVSSDSDSGPNTLRAAITSVNSGTASRPYTISFVTPGPVSLTAALPALVESCTLIGMSSVDINTGSGGTTIERSRVIGTSDFRLFSIGGTNKSVVLSQLTLANGSLPQAFNSGGAVTSSSNSLTLAITDCIMRFFLQIAGKRR